MKIKEFLSGFKWKDYSDSGAFVDPLGNDWFVYNLNTFTYQIRQDTNQEESFCCDCTQEWLKHFKDFAEKKILEMKMQNGDQYLESIINDFQSLSGIPIYDGCVFRYYFKAAKLQGGKPDFSQSFQDYSIAIQNKANNIYIALGHNNEHLQISEREKLKESINDIISHNHLFIFPFNVFDKKNREVTDERKNEKLETISKKLINSANKHGTDVSKCKNIAEIISILDNSGILYRTFKSISCKEIKYLITMNEGGIEMYEEDVEAYKKWMKL